MLKVGQMVKVVNEELDSYGCIGVITDVDTEWMFPYELKFEGGLKFSQELFGKDDIQLLLPKMTNVKKEKSINEDIDNLIERIKGETHNRENALAITKLQEARMWYLEGKK